MSEYRTQFPAIEAQLEAELTAARDRMALVRDEYGRTASAYGKASDAMRRFENAHPELGASA